VRVATSTFFILTAPSSTDLYTLSLHDALPIYSEGQSLRQEEGRPARGVGVWSAPAVEVQLRSRDRRFVGRRSKLYFHGWRRPYRSEEHTSELQSRGHLVCRLLLEKKKIRHCNT